MKWVGFSLLLVAVCLGLVVAYIRWLMPVDPNANNFSQHPGFADYFSRHPPSDDVPTATEQALLRRHAPRIFVGPGEPGPIGFYPDYIAQGTLEAGGQKITSVTSAILNAHRTDPGAVFTNHPIATPVTPVVLGRIDRT